VRKHALLVAVTFLLAPPLGAQSTAGASPPALTLREALARARVENRTLRAATSGVAAARADRRTALSYLLPRISAGASGAQRDREVSFEFGDTSLDIFPRQDWNAHLTVTQPLFAGLRDLRFYQQASAAVDGARAAERGAGDQVLFQVASEYLSAVEADALIDVERRSLDLARARRAQAQALFDAGEVTRVDILRAETAIAAAESRLLAAEQARQVALGRLRVLLVLEGDFSVSEPPDLELPPSPEEADLVARAQASRADLAQARMNARVAALETSKQRGALWPTLMAEGGYIQQKSAFPVAKYSYAMLRLDVPLFRGGEVAARVAAAREREKQAAWMAEQQERQVREDVRTALTTRALAHSGRELAANALRAAEAEYAQAADLYGQHEITAVELESSETALAAARRADVTSRLGEKRAELAVWFAAGSLGQAVLEEEKR
jgi:outer membrane protein